VRLTNPAAAELVKGEFVRKNGGSAELETLRRNFVPVRRGYRLSGACSLAGMLRGSSPDTYLAASKQSERADQWELPLIAAIIRTDQWCSCVAAPM
jgi:hypothetical protein